MSLKSLRDWLGQGTNGSGVGNEPQGKDSAAPLNHTVTHSQDRTALEGEKKAQTQDRSEINGETPSYSGIKPQTEKEEGRNPCDAPGAVFCLAAFIPHKCLRATPELQESALHFTG